jgi:hypothetical protein
MVKHVAHIDTDGLVHRVLVVPDVEDPVGYAAAIGLAPVEELVPAGDAVGVAASGQRYVPGKGFAAEWEQIAGANLGPEGAGSGYPEGAEVWHAGDVWVSTTAGNVWEPGVSGWRRKGEPDAPPPWQQPTGAHDAYAIGAVVSHAGKVWTSTFAANAWEPGVFGWAEVI